MKYLQENMQDTFAKCKLTSEQQQTVIDNYGLVLSFLISKHISFEEGHNPACIGLCYAVIHHNPSKGKLSTLAYKAMTSEYIKSIRRIGYHNFHKSLLSLDNLVTTSTEYTGVSTLEEMIPTANNTEDIEGYIDLLRVLKTFIPTLSPLQKEVFKLKVIYKYGYEEIAKVLNKEYKEINTIYARQIIPRLKTHMKHCGYETEFLTQKLRNKKKKEIK